MAAVKVINHYMLKLLIKKCADISATDNNGHTALHWAAIVDNLKALKVLIRHGPETIKDAQDNKVCLSLLLLLLLSLSLPPPSPSIRFAPLLHMVIHKMTSYEFILLVTFI